MVAEVRLEYTNRVPENNEKHFLFHQKEVKFNLATAIATPKKSLICAVFCSDKNSLN